MKVALIFNPFKYKIHEENMKIIQKYFGLFPPLSLAWVAAIIEKAGHKVIIIDARTLRLSMEETAEMLKDYEPDILGFMMTTYMFQDTLQWIKYLKYQLNVYVMVGGYNLRVYPKESIMHDEIDFGIVEHAYYTVPALLEELETKRFNFADVPGLVYKEGNGIKITDHKEKINFDKFPNPARHLLPNELYAEFPTERRNFTVMVTSLGCPFGCRFCEAGRTEYNPRSVETVIAEIKECYYEYGIREIDIFDYEFTGIRNRVVDICNSLIKENMDLIWACRSRIDTVDEELLIMMKMAGCSRIYFGIESGEQFILDTVAKGIKLDDIKKIISLCKKIGIKTLGFFLIGAPGDTHVTIAKTVKFAKQLDLDYVQFSKCLAKPLTPLWKEMVKVSGYDYWKEWILGNEVDRELPRPWTSLANAEIDELAYKAYISYYMRPKLVLRHLKNIKSFRELKRKIWAGFDMLFRQEKRAIDSASFEAFNENYGKLLDRKRAELKKMIQAKK